MSIFKIPLNRLRLMIEANAGTGKTYTIEGLYIRLILEKKVDLRQVLVVTFTRKATAELQSRILEKMRMVVKYLKSSDESEPPDDGFLLDLLEERKSNRMEDLSRLQQAIYDFDEAQIFTIHGFCQRVLKEEALLTGMPFDVDIHQEDRLLAQATEDYWRVFVSENSATLFGRNLIEVLAAMKITQPSELQKVISPLFDKPYATIHGTWPPIQEYKEDVADLGKLKEQLKAMWADKADEISSKVRSADLKNIKGYEKKFQLTHDYLYQQSLLNGNVQGVTSLSRTQLDSNIKKNKKNVEYKSVEYDPFFDICDQFTRKLETIKDLKTSLLFAAIQDIKSRRQKLLSRGEHLTYQDLLSSVDKALRHEQTGKKLAKRLFQKMPFALVDEFQDTDPVQYAIFKTIYGEHVQNGSLMMIGDPKQSIYRFRGADIFTYLKAKEDALQRSEDAVFVLKKNYRSRPSLIKAVNALFTYQEQPFLLQSNSNSGRTVIGYEPSLSGNEALEEGIIVDGVVPPAMDIIYKGTGGKIDNIKSDIFHNVASQISSMLVKAKEGRFTINKEGEHTALTAGDIAILVQSNRDAAAVKKVLKQYGIGAVTFSRETVFQSQEAEAIYSFMRAALSPGNTVTFNRLLLSGLMGFHLSDLEARMKDDEKRVKMIQELEELSAMWKRRGFYPAFRQFLMRENRLEKIAEAYGAERVLTNLFHLADICAMVEKEYAMMPHALTDWFSRQQSELEQDDEKTLLLESDLNLVKISTIHSAKGLEFPVVFCPTLWHGRSPLREASNNMKTFKEVHTNGEAYIHIDQSDENLENIKTSYVAETIAEEVRKVYVALTRAKYMCILHMHNYTFRHSETHQTGLAALLTEPSRRFTGIDYEAALKDLSAKHHDVIRFQKMSVAKHSFTHTNQEVTDDADDVALQSTGKKNREDGIHKNTKEDLGWISHPDEKIISPEKYVGRDTLSPNRSQYSFSSLVHGGASEDPDHDQVFEKYFGEEEEDFNVAGENHPLLLPKGKNTGSFIHSLFEHPDFQFSSMEETVLHEMISSQLERFRLDKKWILAVRNIVQWVSSTTIEDLSFGELQPKDQLRELEFHFPVQKPDSRNLFSVIRGEHVVSTPRLQRRDVMKGFIDLIARSGDKYYIIDYKSNYLGGKPENYQEDALKKAVLDAGYDLQYSIYLVALSRYLRKWMPGFDPEKHLGGAIYLFVRGMDPDFGPNSGVYFCKPSVETLQMLDEELSRPSFVVTT